MAVVSSENNYADINRSILILSQLTNEDGVLEPFVNNLYKYLQKIGFKNLGKFLFTEIKELFIRSDKKI